MKNDISKNESFLNYDNFKKEFIIKDTQIERVIKRVENIELLSALSIYEHYKYRPSSDMGFYIPMLHHITGLSLKYNILDNIKKPPEVNEVIEIIKLGEEYHQNLHMMTLSEKYLNLSINEEAIIKRVKGRYLINLFNPSKYPFQIKNLINGVFKNFNEYFYSSLGFTLKNALEYADMINKKYVNNVKRKYKNINSNDYKDYINNEVKSLFIFNPNDFKDKTKKLDRFISYLSFLSCEYGSSENANYESPFSDNVIFNKPIIKLDSDTFFVPIPNLLLVSLPRIFEGYIREKSETLPKLYDRYVRHKARYLENEVKKSVERIFPKKSIYNNLYYNFENKKYQLDCVVNYDNLMFFIESKSGNFNYKESDFILRIKTLLKKLVEDAYKQGIEAYNYITNHEEAIFYNRTGKKVIKHNHNEDINKYYFINVTLEPLLDLQTNLVDLNSLGLFSKKEFPWSVYLFELDLITRHLDSPSYFVHYLSNRLHVQKENLFKAMDETGFFSFYLLNGGFQTPREISSKKPDSVFLDFSSEFDNYYLYGGEKPSLKIETAWSNLIKILETLRPPGYTRIALELLNINPEKRTSLINLMNKMLNETKNDSMSHDFTVFIDDDEKTGFTYIVEPVRPYLETKLRKYCLIKKYQLKADKWIGLGRDASDNKYYVNAFFLVDENWKKDPEMEEAVKEFNNLLKNVEYNS